MLQNDRNQARRFSTFDFLLLGLPAVIPEGVNAKRKSKNHFRWSWFSFLFSISLQKRGF